MRVMRSIMKALKLTVNEQKTGICMLPEGRFDFLGYTIGRCYSPKTGKAYIGTRPSKKAIRRICQAISEVTTRRWVLIDAERQVAQLNRKLEGWANYFSYSVGPVSKAYRSVDRHTRHRLREWLRIKHKVAGKGTTRFPDEVLYDRLGRVRLAVRPHNLPWGERMNPCPRAGGMRGKSARPVVCPVKAGVFSRRQTCRGKSQQPRSLDSRVAGDQNPEACRQSLPWGDCESLGRNESERSGGPESAKPRRPSPQPEGEGIMGSRMANETAAPLRRGGSDGTMTRTCRATGEALLALA